ncbi:hypothetical protein [Chryseobacterium culicis]|jgi:hypothetical protein|uniref:Lipoprotein n=1 Tax=Chryseobacterium culicis TaxID=680127 RepID=A0A1H6HG50_CHRCI|nr:hypothetical protein [Chryseobacterium culicis]MBE4948635.1 hypothetical protein [Chryseobacterium culicis]SEH33215.1 hypothetical protein SAMN05421593_2205 [Chryseobacterium culicis]
MKKLIICLAIATVAVSCKKVPAGGNKNTLKLEEGVERYSDDAQGGEAHGHGHEAAATAEGHKEEAAKPEAAAPKTDSTAAAKPAEAEKAPKAEH